MPLKPLKAGATQEEINAWIVQASEDYTRIESDLESNRTAIETKDKRIKDLEEHNQKLFLRVTTPNLEDKSTEQDEIPSFLNKDTFNLLDKHDKKLLENILEEEE
jgi:carboxypeptidase C (cathepsin A)